MAVEITTTTNGAGRPLDLSELTTLLKAFTTSINSAVEALPSVETILPPDHGVSLLATKNEAFLEYLWNVVFLMVTKLRGLRGEENNAEEQILGEEAVNKLVELRVYLDRGVRPLESRLKFQIDKAIRAADERQRVNIAKSQNGAKKPIKKKHAADEEHSEEDSEGSDEASDEDDVEEPSLEQKTYGPNISSLANPYSTLPSLKASKDARLAEEDSKPGVYRPPRINPTALPDAATKATRKPQKSHTVDDYIASEISAAPLAEPSIGSTIVSGGRHMTSQRERAEQAEKRAYEESNFVRLPAKSKKEAAKERGKQRMGYGGEEWRGLGEGLDRINDLTKGKGGRGALDKSRKRERDVQDGTRGTGVAGEMFERKKRRLAKRR